MKTLITLLLFVTTSAFAGGQHPFDPLPPNCSAPFELSKQIPAGYSYCCSTKVTFVAPPAENCVSGYTVTQDVKPKPKKTTYYFCCKMNNPNTGSGDPRNSNK